MTRMLSHSKAGVERVSVSLPPEIVEGLDGLTRNRGFESRSAALAWVIREQLREESEENPEAVMTGSITLFFRQSRPGILEELAALKRKFIDEVIGTLQVQLTDGHLMEVLLVQGPVRKLRELTDAIVACRGVKAGRLTLTSDIMPPIHPLPETHSLAGNSKTRPADVRKSSTKTHKTKR